MPSEPPILFGCLADWMWKQRLERSLVLLSVVPAPAPALMHADVRLPPGILATAAARQELLRAIV